jgi:ferredoxin
MPRPRILCHSADTLLSPLRLETRKVDAEETGGALLRSVAPEALTGADAQLLRLVIDPVMDVPFGPSEAQLLSLLPCSLDAAVRAVSEGLSLPVSLSRARRRGSDAGVVVLDLHELAKLHATVTTGEFEDAVLVSCFIRPGQVYAARAPRGLALGDLLAAIPEVKAHMDACPDDTPVHPLSGDALDLSQPCNAPSTLVSFPDNGYALAPPRSFLFPFPAFNRQLAMQDSATDIGTCGPCSNCLACVRYCPAGIQPALIYHYLAADKTEDAVPLGLLRCTECGWCSFVCPSRIPLCRKISAGLAALAAEGDEEEDAGDA